MCPKYLLYSSWPIKGRGIYPKVLIIQKFVFFDFFSPKHVNYLKISISYDWPMLIVLQPKVNSESFFLSLLNGASALIIYHQDLKTF